MVGRTDGAHDGGAKAPAPGNFSQRYTSAVVAHARSIVLLSILVAAVAASFAAKLPVYADFSWLLPERSESVQQLRALAKRARVLGTLMVVVSTEEPARREPAALELKTALDGLGPELVSHLTYDRHEMRGYAWDNRWLLADVADLRRAKEALPGFLAQLRRRTNPLVVDFEDEAAEQSTADVQGLQQKLDELSRQHDDPGTLVSPDGKLRLFVLQTPFAAGDTTRGNALLDQVRAAAQRVEANHPGVKVGLAGDVLSSLEEQRAILQGMLVSTAATAALVLLGLYFYLRSVFAVVALGWALSVGTLVTFMVTRLTVGHLNIATAFLASIVLGNGINFGIMVSARYFECLRSGARGTQALTTAVGGTARGTLAAALAATVAYASLMSTEFRGFHDFGLIASTGMVCCWFASYTVLPAVMALGAERGWLHATPQPAIGRALSALLPRRTGAFVAVNLVVAGICSLATWQYLVHNPYEQNFRNLRSDSRALLQEQAWMHEIDRGFGQGISGGFVVAVPERAQVPAVLARLRAVDAGKEQSERLFGRVNGLDDFLPADVDEKRALLRDVRAQILRALDGPMNAKAKKKLRELCPPETLQVPTDADVPKALAWPFTEADGTRGRMVLANSGPGFHTWEAADLMRFADAVRALKLGPDVLVGGSAFVFSDMLRLIEHDGPRATLAAMVAAAAVVVCTLGITVYAGVTIACGYFGTVAMLALSAAIGIKVNFLDFVALPITIGIGIDYAVNIAARAREEGAGRGRRALAGAGGAVFLASYTTIIGYGSLLLSHNKGIRSFGHAAILGELTCLAVGLYFAPALLDVLQRGARTGREDPATSSMAD